MSGKPAQAQKLVTTKQQQAIREIATGRVAVFTSYLSLLAKEQDQQKIITYEKYLGLSLHDHVTSVRVYNDLLPLAVTEKNPILDRHLPLTDYLNQLAVNYSYNLHLSYNHLNARNIYYSEHLNKYYVIVSAQREISGNYRNGNRLIENKGISDVDFYVQVELKDNAFSVGGIFGIEPHAAQPFPEVELKDDPSLGEPDMAQPFRGTIKAEASKKTVRLKRGKEYELKWTGGLENDIIEVELIPADNRNAEVIKFDPHKNRNTVRLFIDENVRRGLYKFRITNISTGRYTQTGFIKIKKKFLLFWAAVDNNPLRSSDFMFPLHSEQMCSGKSQIIYNT